MSSGPPQRFRMQNVEVIKILLDILHLTLDIHKYFPFMLNSVFLVGIGGAAGSIARFLTGYYVNKFIISPFPYGTFTANILGCFIIGLVFGLVQRFEWFTPELRLLFATGFCGGYTTFSTFAYENLHLLQTQQYSAFAIYTFISFSIGIMAVAAGLFLINKI